MSIALELAPTLQVRQWLNTPEAISLEGLRGRVVVLHAFQMLCPGCVSQGDTREAAVQNIREAIEGYVLALKDDGLSVPA